MEVSKPLSVHEQQEGNDDLANKNKSCSPTIEPISPTNDSGGEEPTPPRPQEPLYFTRDGKALFGVTPPSAFVLQYPSPLPTNLSKNRVLRPVDEEGKERVKEGIAEAEKEFEKEAMPLPGLLVEGVPLQRGLVPEIELALYWDRHPYEYRTAEDNIKRESLNGMRRSKSDINLASKAADMKSGKSASSVTSRSSLRSSSATSLKREPSPATPSNHSDNHCTNGKCHKKKDNHKLHMSENDLKKFEDIKKRGRKSEGVQVALEDINAAALKSTYLCPLHGQYRKGVERREKGGFRTDMSSLTNVHAFCSRALKGRPSRTKLIKTVETQTDNDMPDGPHVEDLIGKVKRSKTAGHSRYIGTKKDIMASEYHGSYKNPFKIAEAEKRHLRNKILNYCFTKHSIF